jgi:predicted metallopeptidase
MIPEVKKDILSALGQAIDCILKDDLTQLNLLSNYTIHNASIFQDEDSVSIAVVIYALSKIFEREHGIKDKKVVEELKNAFNSLSEDDFHSYKQCIHNISNIISKLDSKLRLYIEQVINQSQIRKGSKIYEHGISLARASEMLGISQWELMTYVGNTQIIDKSEKVRRVANRLKFARSLFGL